MSNFDALAPGRLTYRTSDGKETWIFGDGLVLNGEHDLELRILLANAEFVVEYARQALIANRMRNEGYGLVTVTNND